MRLVLQAAGPADRFAICQGCGDALKFAQDTNVSRHRNGKRGFTPAKNANCAVYDWVTGSLF
jgi:hypothetical protein